MLIIEKVRYKNFLASGNHPIEIDFTKNKRTLILGKNGAGKTTLIEALHFAFFNKPFRSSLNKGDVVNTINKNNCVVEVEMKKFGKSYLIRRGVKPNFFQIIIDGVEENKESSVLKDQGKFEKNILGMNDKTFSQIIVIGTTTFTPFMRLKVPERRPVIDNILNIENFSMMNVVAKKNVSDTKKEISDIQDKIDGIERNMSVLQDTIDDLKENDKNRDKIKQQKIKKLKENIKAFEEEWKEISILNNDKELEEQHKDLMKKVEKYRDTFNIITEKKKNFRKELKFFSENEECPTCQQEIDKDFRSNKIKERSDTLKEIDAALSKLEKAHNKSKTEAGDISEKLEEHERGLRKIERIKDKIRYEKEALKEIEEEDENITSNKRVIDDTQKSYDNLKENAVELQKKYNELIEDQNYNTAIVELLKDSGIKSVIIKKYMPFVNKAINEYLEKMNFFCRFELDENFEETIFSRHIDQFKYGNFSNGEKMRIDLAILFGWRKIAKVINSIDCNLIIFDEILDSSLDDEGTEDCVNIIQQLADNNTNVFVISHKENMMLDKFDNVIRFEKVKDFSVKKETE